MCAYTFTENAISKCCPINYGARHVGLPSSEKPVHSLICVRSSPLHVPSHFQFEKPFNYNSTLNGLNSLQIALNDFMLKRNQSNSAFFFLNFCFNPQFFFRFDLVSIRKMWNAFKKMSIFCVKLFAIWIHLFISFNDAFEHLNRWFNIFTNIFNEMPSKFNTIKRNILQNLCNFWWS